jgi:3-isopropylmalate/(R)-2-methylmalate dehydratase small subunit
MTMAKFTEHTGIGAPLRISDVDTDQIFPARFCSGVTKDGLGDAVLADWRSDPDFVLSQPAYRDATVLVAGENFGTGSSREWAVWALQDYGFRVILSSRFGDIFRGNSLKNGLLTVELPPEAISQIWDSLDSRPDRPITTDLEKMHVRVGHASYPFTLDEHTRWRLLNGYDDIGLTLAHIAEIGAYEAGRRRSLPTARHIEPKVPHHA